MNDLIYKIVGTIIEVGQSDIGKFRLGETIRYAPSEILEILKQHEDEIFGKEPSAQSQIIRCRDCKNYQDDWKTSYPNRYYCAEIDGFMHMDDYCSFAERKKE